MKKYFAETQMCYLHIQMRRIFYAIICLHRFTLLELTAVIAIICILTALLLPTLSKAKSMALGYKCLSNQRIANVALNMYLHDSNGWMNHYGSPVQYWANLIMTGNYVNSKSYDVFECPLIIGKTSMYYYYIYGFTSSYQNFNNIRRPSTMTMFADAANATTGSNSCVLHTSIANYLINMRHASLANIAFADGHGKGVTVNDLSGPVSNDGSGSTIMIYRANATAYYTYTKAAVGSLGKPMSQVSIAH